MGDLLQDARHALVDLGQAAALAVEAGGQVVLHDDLEQRLLPPDEVEHVFPDQPHALEIDGARPLGQDPLQDVARVPEPAPLRHGVPALPDQPQGVLERVEHAAVVPRQVRPPLGGQPLEHPLDVEQARPLHVRRQRLDPPPALGVVRRLHQPQRGVRTVDDVEEEPAVLVRRRRRDGLERDALHLHRGGPRVRAVDVHVARHGDAVAGRDERLGAHRELAAVARPQRHVRVHRHLAHAHRQDGRRQPARPGVGAGVEQVLPADVEQGRVEGVAARQLAGRPLGPGDGVVQPPLDVAQAAEGARVDQAVLGEDVVGGLAVDGVQVRPGRAAGRQLVLGPFPEINEEPAAAGVDQGAEAGVGVVVGEVAGEAVRVPRVLQAEGEGGLEALAAVGDDERAPDVDVLHLDPAHRPPPRDDRGGLAGQRDVRRAR